MKKKKVLPQRIPNCQHCDKGSVSMSRFYNQVTFECDGKKCDFLETKFDYSYKIPTHYTKLITKVVATRTNSFETQKKRIEMKIKINPDRLGLYDELRLLKNQDTILYDIIKEEITLPVDITQFTHYKTIICDEEIYEEEDDEEEEIVEEEEVDETDSDEDLFGDDSSDEDSS